MKRPVGAAAVLAAVCFLVFNANGREIASYDSQPAKFLALEIVQHHSLTLNHVVGRLPGLAYRPGFVLGADGNYRAAYPLPSAGAAALVAFVLSKSRLVDLDALYAPALIAKLTASLLTALAVAFAYLAAARRTSPARAMLIALAFGLGTNLWSSVSQTLWQQELSLPCLMGAVFLLDDADLSGARLLTVGAALGLAGWARPQVAPQVLIFAIAAIVRWHRRGLFAWAPIVMAAAAATAINLAWFGNPLGADPYLETLHQTVHGVSGSVARAPWQAAAGLLISPSRGLLIFSPVVLVALTGLSQCRREDWTGHLRWTGLAALVQGVAYAFYAVWWAGHTFGPRYLVDALPALVPIAAAGMPVLARRRSVQVLAVGALLWSTGVAALGAFVYPAENWNSEPTDVDRAHHRLWEWRDSQILRAAETPARPRNFILFSRAAVRRPPP